MVAYDKTTANFSCCIGALLKAAVCCTNIIDITSNKTLQQQLQEKYNGGFEVQSWSNLPKGSGLGSSSILSGVLMAALLSAAGIAYDTNSLIHAVLHLEQMMTTGGGWQDQVGGLLPGIKLGTSEGKLPLKVEAEVLKIDDNKMKRILDHSVLVFTGKPRLAKNMLQVYRSVTPVRLFFFVNFLYIRVSFGTGTLENRK